jgi:hypothetical protein
MAELTDRRYCEAFAVLEAMPDPPTRLMGSILGNWALLAHERGLVEEAKSRYQRALVIQQQTLGGATRWWRPCVIAMPVSSGRWPMSTGGTPYPKGLSHPDLWDPIHLRSWSAWEMAGKGNDNERLGHECRETNPGRLLSVCPSHRTLGMSVAHWLRRSLYRNSRVGQS